MNRLWPFRSGGRIAIVAVIVAAILGFVLLRGTPKRTAALAATSTGRVERRDITVTVEATGTVEPINLVEVKSKASGQIVRMPVEIGSAVGVGDLLVQVDPRDVRNAFDQAQAAMVASEARAQVAAQQRTRADDLFAGQVITATEHEAAMLDDANAKAELIGARTNLDIARQRLEDATVRAPIAGTVLEKPVAVGQVISSATASVSGGTVLLKMADLSRIRMRALVVETDIGRVAPGQDASVVVDAYPQRTFRGTVEKIEPQALVQQSVTMFPVLISISNEDGLLLPGMNGEVTMLVDERRNALAVPLDALRSARDMAAIASALGLDPDSLRARMRRGVGGGGASGASGASDGGADRTGGSATAGTPAATVAGGGGADSASVRRARRGSWSAERGRAGAAGDSAAGARRSVAVREGAVGGSGPASGTRGGSRAQVAVVKTANGFEPRMVRIGISDFEYAEVLRGLEEGDEVVLLGELEVQAERDEQVNRVRARVGGGVTGTGSTSTSRSGGP